MPTRRRRHALAQPPGRRTCWRDEETAGDGGIWHVPRDRLTGGAPWWTEDFHRALGRFEGQPRKMLASEIKSKLERGSRGELTFGSGRAADVDLIASVEGVLEIRFGYQHGDIPLARLHTRIYFSEPAREPGVLKLLTIDCKHDFPQGKTEQNQHASRAASRLDSCIFEPLDV